MKLTKSQINYAMSRLADKIKNKRNEIPKVDSAMNDADKVYAYIESKGCAVLFGAKSEFFNKFHNSYYLRNFINDVINFDESFNQEYENFQQALKDFDNKYNKISQDIEDQLNLCGDAEQALTLINSI